MTAMRRSVPSSFDTKDSLKQHGLAPSKKRGQNFLVHRATAEALVASARFSPDDRVIEVGVGLGALTIPLAAQVSEVIGIEIDSGLIRYHEQENILPSNVTLVHGDILRFDLRELREQFGHRLKIIANLPYSISNPFIFRMIEQAAAIEQVCVMLQKEVAERLTAAVGSKSYGIPTVLLGSCAKTEKLMQLSPAEFYPQPKIDSLVLRISFFPDGKRSENFPFLQEVVRAAFANRRKTLLNNLTASGIGRTKISADMGERKKLFASAIATLGTKSDVRGETLSIDQFKSLSRALENILASEYCKQK